MSLVILQMIERLSGVNSQFFSTYGGVTQDEDSLLIMLKHRKDNRGILYIYASRFMSAFWAGECSEANKWLDLALSLKSKTVTLQIIHLTFFSGLLAFRRYRDGEGEEFLAKGQVVLEKMRVWRNNSKAIFENKCLLLESERDACLCNIVASKRSYELSARSAHDHGLVHEQGLAYELYGNFLSSIGDQVASQWFQKAYTCYLQWGAVAKAEQLRKDLNLDSTESFSVSLRSTQISTKHGRDEGNG